MASAKLLLVDDDPLILATFRHGLRARGYAVVAATGADAALAGAAAEPFDLAILDIRMPGTSGLELGRLLRERHELPSLYLTAMSDGDSVAQAIREGALTYLVKPVEIAQLIAAVEAALARAQEIRALAGQKAHLDRALAGSRHASVAIGMLMERHRLTEQQAFEMLRAEARRQSRKFDDYCEDLIEVLISGKDPALVLPPSPRT